MKRTSKQHSLQKTKRSLKKFIAVKPSSSMRAEWNPDPRELEKVTFNRDQAEGQDLKSANARAHVRRVLAANMEEL